MKNEHPNLTDTDDFSNFFSLMLIEIRILS